MCGIVGIASGYQNGFSQKEVDVFTELLFHDQLRGFDSTGVFGADCNSNVLIHKEASTATDFLGTKEFRSFKRHLIADGLFAVGHNRAATRGNVVDQNAHPFWIDDKVVLVQNGTWRGCHKSVKDTEVDTEALAHIIADEPVLEKALGRINAAYALVWFNTETHTLNLLRNFERPLWLAETMMGGLLWASESTFIQAACQRQDLGLKAPPVMLEPMTHVELKINGRKWDRVDTKVTPTFPKTTHNHYQGWQSPVIQPPVNLNARGGRGYVESLDHEVKITLPEFLMMKRHEYHLTRDQGLEAVKEFTDVISGSRKQMFEMVDYEPANNSATCKTWHIYGAFLAPEGSLSSRVVGHFFTHNKTEQEVMDMVTTPWWEGYITAVRSNVFNEMNTAVVTAFISNPQPYVVPNHALASTH